MTGHVAAEAGHLAGTAGDDHPVRHDRAARVADKKIAAAIGLPDQLAGAGIQRDDDVVPAHEVDVVAVERDAALALSVVGGERLLRRQLVPVLPDQIARRSVDRLDHVAGIPEIHHAVVDERRRLVDAGLHRAGPDQLQILHVGLVDLVERAVAPRLIVAAMNQPVLRLGRPDDLVGDRDEVRHGPRCSRRCLSLSGRVQGTQQSRTEQCQRDRASHRTLPGLKTTAGMARGFSTKP